MHPIIDDLNWRYATKKFDPNKKISSETWAIIQESLRLVPTSYGIQAMKFILVESAEIREQLKEAAYGQTPITDASHLLVLCAFKELSEQHLDEYIQLTSNTRSIDLASMDGFAGFLKSTVGKMSTEEQTAWNSKQVYIALGQLLHTCATLKVDSLPMEGFNSERFNEILKLEEQNLTSVLVCPIGYRHADDATQASPKVRKSLDELFRKV
ncbi:MAG: NAD(P)H-dependent oxidoreductase [Crocinitomicaceae bacterium]|nr:NAD(P)H-dependent oxidoreductase [Crocinitomicaceae bacterium]